ERGGVGDVGLAGVMQDRGGEEAEVRRRARDVEPARERDRLAVVAALETRERLEVLFDQVRELQQHARALFRGRAAPRWKGRLRRRDRGVDVRAVAVGDLRDDVAARGLEVVEVRAAMRRDKLAVDEVSEAQHTPPDRTPTGRCPGPTSPTGRSSPCGPSDSAG